MSDRTPDITADHSRLLLQTLVGAATPARKPAPPNPLAVAMDELIRTLTAISVPRIPVEPEPYELEELNVFMGDYTKAFDALHRVVGEQLRANSPTRVDMACFTRTFTDAIDGMATYEVNKAADTMRDDREEATR